MLRFNERNAGSRPANARPSRNRKRMPVTAGLRDWRVEMSQEEIRDFEATGGDLLDELGYARSALTPDEGTVAEAARVRDAFLEGMRRRGRPLPRSWRGEPRGGMTDGMVPARTEHV
jgi:hypothetical protein